MASKCDQLEAVFKDRYGDNNPLLLINPDEPRDYTNDEIQITRQRDFKTRWMVCSTAISGKSVILRTHFTDNHEFESHLNYVRDFFKGQHVTDNPTASKAAATELLSMFFAFEPSEYYSFAVTVASALSRFGENVSFQNSLLKGEEELDMARRKLCLLMDVLFSKVSMYRFLIQEDGNNTYRLVHCGTKHLPNKKPLRYALFSFLLQFCLTAYVVAENLTTGFYDYKLRNLPLAIFTFIYSAMIAYPGMTDGHIAMKLYGKIGPLQMVDFFVNHFLAGVLLFSGFFVIFVQESYIEAVLNTAALLFIPEIDDQLPQLLGMDAESIIKNYLTHQALKQFDKLSLVKDKTIDVNFLQAKDKSIGVPFVDYYLTNIPEQAAFPKDGINFTPYQVTAGKNGAGHQIDPSSFVTEQCLIKKLVWSYAVSEKYANTTKPRIGYLKIIKINGDIVEIQKKGIDKDIIVSDFRNVLEGIFIITSFQMSDTIFRLRICGSPTARNFLDAFEYYSLWGLSENARKLLDKTASKNKKKDSFLFSQQDGSNHYYDLEATGSSSSRD